MSRRLRHLEILVVVAAIVAVCAASVRADYPVRVPVGNAGNPGESSGDDSGYGPIGICGGVPYEYQIGKYEVTAQQYRDFLNAVAATDPYNLYSESMSSDSLGCQIQRSGSPGSYHYDVMPGYENRPVNYVTWGDAARFANWLSKGQPTGPQGPNTTEDGSYCLNGAMTNAELLAVTRKANATWVIPTEDEWYKAAYHKNDGPTGSYWDYPTQSNDPPIAEEPPGHAEPPGSANYDNAVGHFTDVGAYIYSPSAYGTYDQGGNVWEWNETRFYEQTLPSGSYIPDSRGDRGGAFSLDAGHLNALGRFTNPPTDESDYIGFRVGFIPEPTTMGLLLLAGVSVLRRKRT